MDVYILKSTACLAILLVFYKLFLENQNMHHFKRYYLLMALVFALSVPFITFTEYIEPTYTTQTYQPSLNSMVYFEVSEEPQINYWPIVLWSIYGLGVLLFLTKFLLNLFYIFKKVRTNETQYSKSFIYVLLNDLVIPHSFFSYIFLNKDYFKSEQIPSEVLIHEQTHAKQKHGLDVMAIELLQIVFWFHPLIYVLKHAIKLNHEFLADEAVINQGVNPSAYQQLLLAFSSKASKNLPTDVGITSAINYSSIKKRFTVMNTQTSKTRIWISTLLLLPIIAILFYSFAEKEYVQKENSKNSEAITTELEKTNDLQAIYQDGATEAMMKEYKDWMEKLNNSLNLNIPVGTFERLVAIYDLMSDEQRKSVKPYPFLQDTIETNLYKVNPSVPTVAQFESWKNEKEFAISLDGKHISNSELNNYKLNDIAHYSRSKTHNNAKSEKFAQPFQLSLYTKDGFNKFYKEAFVSDYRALTKTYSNGIGAYLNGPQTDNSELRIIKAQADKFYYQFSKDELIKYNILPAPPVPSEKKLKSPHSSTKESKGEATSEDTTDIHNPSFLEYIIEMEGEGASFYLDNKKIAAEEAKSIAKNNSGKRTEMITEKDAKGKYLVKLSSSEKNNIYARSIDLKILNDDSYLIDGIKATKRTFVNVFNQLHQDITSEVRNKIINIHVSSAKDISNKEVWFIYNSLQDYGFYRIVAPNQEINRAKGNTPFAIESHFITQEKPMAKQISDYNAWAKKINTAMVKAEANKRSEYPMVQQKEYDEYKRIYMDLMSPQQRQNAEPWPNFPPPPPAPPKLQNPPTPAAVSAPLTHEDPPAPPKPENQSKIQQKATQEEISEYNKLTKHCNNQLKNDTPIIKVKDVKRIKFLYAKMSDDQKKNAEPYPDFSKTPPPIAPADPPAPPAPPKLKSAYEFVKSLKNDDITYYFNEKEVSYEDILKITKANPKISIHSNIENNKGYVKFWIED